MILLALGTNDWGNESVAYKGILAAVNKFESKLSSVILILPCKFIHGLPYAYNAAMKVAKEKSLRTEYPETWDGFHMTINAANKIKSRYPNAIIWGDSNAVRLGAKEGVTGFTGKSALWIADRIK